MVALQFMAPRLLRRGRPPLHLWQAEGALKVADQCSHPSRYDRSGFGANSLCRSAVSSLLRCRARLIPSYDGSQSGPTQIPRTQVFILQCVTYQVIRKLAAGTPGQTSTTSVGQCSLLGPRNSESRSMKLLDVLCRTASRSEPLLADRHGIEDIQFAYACDGCLLPASGLPSQMAD